MTTDKTFLGRGWGFPPEFGRRAKSVHMVAAERDIEESLRILLSTAPGERVMQPAYGCGMKRQVFGTINETTLSLIEDSIRRAVLFFEPRITLDDVETDTSRVYDGVLSIKLVYTVRATNSRSNMVYPFYFLEGTDIRT